MGPARQRPKTLDVINPATEQAVARISAGSALTSIARSPRLGGPSKRTAATSREERVAILERVIAAGMRSASTKSRRRSRSEMGAPLSLAKAAQAPAGLAHLKQTLACSRNTRSRERRHDAHLREPVGVCGLITPWNWPMNQIMCKVAPALAAGCTMVLKPSEVAPLSGILTAQVLHEAGVPAVCSTSSTGKARSSARRWLRIPAST